MDETTVSVPRYACNCDWVTKYCDEEHRVYAKVPVSVLMPYVVGS